MPRLTIVERETATGAAKELLDGVHANFGTVPNIFKSMVNSPGVLKALFGINENLEGAELSLAEREAIALAVSQHNECNYCQAAHTAIAAGAGVDGDEAVKIRQGEASDPKVRALTDFAMAVIQNKGFVSDADLGEVRAAGYGDGAIVEVVLVVAQTAFTNFFNHVNETELDFPAVPEV